MPRPAKRPRPQDAREQQRDAAAAVLERSAYNYGSGRAAKVEACARKVRSTLLEAPPRPVSAPAKLALCAPKGLKNEHAACAFAAPAKVTVVGSWLLRTGLKRQAEMDLAVQLPDALITTKDLANGRYLAKRCAYLEQCAEVLREAGYQVTKVAFQRDERRPILEVADDEGGVVRVLAAWAAPAKARLLLAPARNNVRAADGSCTSSTPAYNAALLGDAALDRHLQLLHGACSADAAIVDATVLLKARRRARITICAPSTRRRRRESHAESPVDNNTGVAPGRGPAL